MSAAQPETPFRRMAGLAQTGAAVLLWVLLGSYLIFNKAAALIGFPPVYAGEMVLAVALAAALPELLRTLPDALRRSWPLRLAAALFIYGLIRTAAGAGEYGLLAARDGITTGYALLAFAAPLLWSSLRRGGSGGGRFSPLPSQVNAVVLPVSLAAAALAAGIYSGRINILGTWLSPMKPDFITLSAAVAFWACAILAFKHHPFRPPQPPLRILSGAGAALLSALALFLVCLLPTRGVLVAVLPLAALLILAHARTRRRLLVVCALGVLCTGLALPKVLPRASAMVSNVRSQYAPEKELAFDIHAVERDLRSHPEVYPVFDVAMDLTSLGSDARRERLGSILFSSEKDLSTLEGRRAGHANEWRMACWLRTWHYTLAHAPVFGIGFGPNLMNLNRRSPDVRAQESPAWRMFIPAMSVGLRSPHSAHLTILGRLGLAGLILWLALLIAVYAGALRMCWTLRRREAECRLRQDASNAERHRTGFWNGVLVLGLWTIYVTAMSFGVVLENPFGGMWFWSLTGVLAFWPLECHRAS